MGWTTTSDFERYHKGLFSIREYLDREFAQDHPDYPRHEVLDSSLHGKTEYYAAIRSTPREGGDRKTGEATVFGLVVMVSYKPRDPDGHTLGWKEMSEASMPYLFNCPERILKRLDAPYNDNAAEWRRRCREARASKARVKRDLAHGAVIEFEAPLRFTGGSEHRRFTVEKHGRKTLFRAGDGMLCRIPKIAGRDFRLVEPVA